MFYSSHIFHNAVSKNIICIVVINCITYVVVLFLFQLMVLFLSLKTLLPSICILMQRANLAVVQMEKYLSNNVNIYYKVHTYVAMQLSVRNYFVRCIKKEVFKLNLYKDYYCCIISYSLLQMYHKINYIHKMWNPFILIVQLYRPL